MPPPSAIQGDASVQQGLSAAYESIAFCKHRRAADKRYSFSLAVAMKREGLIYVVFALAGLLMAAYLGNKTWLAQHLSLTRETVVIAAAGTAVLGLLGLMYSVLAFLFLRRAVLSIESSEGEFVVRAVCVQNTFRASRVRLIKRLGAQFSHDETRPAFTLFVANGGLWICNSELFQGVAA